MIKKVLFALLGIQCAFGVIEAQKANKMLFSATKPNHIFVNNRILAKVNENAISTIDVMKKMDLLFYRQFPQYANSVEARYQFYNMNWNAVLKEMVEKELILADAETVNLEVSNGDVRQELETLFGPNIIANLDKIGLSYDDALTMVKEDLTIKRMMGGRVNAKAVRSITPSEVKAAYEEFVEADSTPDQWKYQVITIRGEDSAAGAEAANHVHHYLVEEGVSIDQILNNIKENSLTDDKIKYSISDEFTHNEKEVSEGYRNTLSTLMPGHYSQPIAQQSRATQQMVYRIFYLKEFLPGGAPEFSFVENKIKNMLIEKVIERETTKYLAKLRQHFDVQIGEQHNMYPEDYKPFILK